MRQAIFLLALAASAADQALLWRDPGPIASLDLKQGPAGEAAAPVAPFTFVKEVTQGISPKVVVTDAKGGKWMVKFGEEVKSENFASRIAWAAGYPVRPSFYVKDGTISGIKKSKRLGSFVKDDGTFQEARFQLFDGPAFHEVPGPQLNLADKKEKQQELNGLKLALLLLSNWDVKPANSAIFEIDGKHYQTVSDWGASMGDPSASVVAERKWNCSAYKRQTSHLFEGIDNGYAVFNYQQYAARHEGALASGIRVEDIKWFTDRMSGLTDDQLKAALQVSGATEEETTCFSGAVRERLNKFVQIANGNVTRTVTTTTTTK